MEAPEKLYVDTNDNLSDSMLYGFIEKRKDDDIEYTRTDAIVERACELLVNCIEDFMFRRMEIWTEESKKQTLENIRKNLKE